MLTHMQKDALTEILNVQLGSAANMLSEMVNQKIILSVPELELQKGSELEPAALLDNDMICENEAIITTVTFGGQFEGSAAVIFPQDKASSLVNACLGNDNSEVVEFRLSNEDADVIKEICNIILNALLGEFGNILDVKLEYASLDTGFSLEQIQDKHIIPNDSEVMVLYTSFFLTKSRVRGIILIALPSGSYQMLIDKIDIILRGLDV